LSVEEATEQAAPARKKPSTRTRTTRSRRAVEPTAESTTASTSPDAAASPPAADGASAPGRGDVLSDSQPMIQASGGESPAPVEAPAAGTVEPAAPATIPLLTARLDLLSQIETRDAPPVKVEPAESPAETVAPDPEPARAERGDRPERSTRPDRGDRRSDRGSRRDRPDRGGQNGTERPHPDLRGRSDRGPGGAPGQQSPSSPRARPGAAPPAPSQSRNGSAPHLTLLDLEAKTPEELFELARTFELQGYSRLPRPELKIRLLRAQTERDGNTFGDGILEIIEDGFGFLRGPRFLPGPDDIYVSQSQIRRFGLRTGDRISGQVRPPKDNEKFFSLLRVEVINDLDPDTPAAGQASTPSPPSFPWR
jgi:hypothetical protein